jgi:hypothetical protein
VIRIVKRNTMIILMFFLIILAILFSSASFRLKATIVAEYPSIISPFISDYDKANILRQWSYEHTKASSKHNLLELDESFGFYIKNTEELFTAFSEYNGGVWCGGSAYVLSKLYQSYGYKAYTVDSGEVGVLTHVVTIVEIDYDGRKILSVQDPTFNITYENSSGIPYDYFELLKTLKKHNHKNITINQGNGSAPDFILDPRDDCNDYAQYISSSDKPFVKLTGERLVYKSRLTLARFDDKYKNGSIVNEFLLKEGHPPKTLYLFLYPLYMYGETEATHIFEQAKEIVN